MGPRQPASTVLSLTEEAVIVEFRRRTMLPLDDVPGCLRESIPSSPAPACIAASGAMASRVRP
jgi:hypothetical protein